jgi:hypothetical protein
MKKVAVPHLPPYFPTFPHIAHRYGNRQDEVVNQQESITSNQSQQVSDNLFSPNRTERFAAEFFGVSLITLRRMRQSGRGPRYYLLGRSVRYRLVDLQNYLHSLPGGGGEPSRKRGFCAGRVSENKLVQ